MPLCGRWLPVLSEAVASAPLLTAPPTAVAPLQITWDGRPVAATVHDTISSALLAAGHLMTSRSPKYRRPRGAYCLLGDCGTCLVRVDGHPNIRACLTAVQPGMQVTRQNSHGPIDPTAMIDHAFPGGVDHHHLMVRPRLVNAAMQTVARNLTGFGTLPDHPLAGSATCETHSPEVLVIGAGPAGRTAAATLVAAGITVLLVDRRDHAALIAADPSPLPATTATLAVFAAYPHEGLWAATTQLPASTAPTLHMIRPRHVILALGAHVPTIPIPGNDLPGVVSARGLGQLLARSQRTLAAKDLVVVGDSHEAIDLAHTLAADLIATQDLVRIVGNQRVKAIETAKGRRPCRLVALAPEVAPASSLAAQAGAALQWQGGGFVPVCAPDGRVRQRDVDHPLAGPVWSANPPDAATLHAKPTPWGLWAAGELLGVPRAQAAASGETVAQAIISTLAHERSHGDGRP